MISIADLLSSVRADGIHVWLEGQQLRYRTARPATISIHLDKLRAHKIAIVEYLEGLNASGTTRIGPRSKLDTVPLTPIQQMSWNHYVTSGYVPQPRFSSWAFKTSGSLDIHLLGECLQLLIHRHESLRTKIAVVGGVPTQHVEEYTNRSLHLIDISRNYSEMEANSLIDEFLCQKIDLSIGPLFDVLAIKCSHDDHLLVMSLDHMITDFISNRILKEELWTIYRQLICGEPIRLPDVPLQQPDYAVWLQKTYRFWQETHGQYWASRLAGARRIHFPVDGMPHEAGGSATLELQFGETLTKSLLDFARRQSCPPALVMLTIYIAVLSRWCDQTDLTVVLVDTGRHRPELQRVIGWLTAHLLVRVELESDETFHDLLEDVKREFIAASEHQDSNRVLLANKEWVADLYFNWRTNHNSAINFGKSSENRGGIGIRPFPTKMKAASMGMAIFFQHENDELTGTVSYGERFFTRGTAKQFARNMSAFLDVLVQSPSCRITAVPMETE